MNRFKKSIIGSSVGHRQRRNTYQKKYLSNIAPSPVTLFSNFKLNLLLMLSLPAINYVNNATKKNKLRNERISQAILNSNSNANPDNPYFGIPTDLHPTYPNGIYDINTNVRMPKRKRGRPSTKTTNPSPSPSPRKINHSMDKETVIRVIDAFRAGASVRTISIIFGISQSSTYKLLADYYKRHDYPFRSSRGGARTRKISSEDSEYFCDLIRNNPQITSKEIKEKLQEHNGKVVSTSAINKHLKGRMSEFDLPNFTIKKCVYIENRRNSPEILEKRVKYINIYRECLRLGKDFVFIDETPFNSLYFYKNGRSPVGIPCRVSRQHVKISNLTAITAIHRTFGIVKTTFVDGPVNQEVFTNFLDELFQTMTSCKTRPIYVMDNVSFHKTKNITGLFDRYNNTCLLTVPWSCELNPIEYIFGIWKRRIKINRTVQLSEIKEVIKNGLLSITQEEVSKTIYYVETIIFQQALNRKNLALQRCQHFYHEQYLKVGSDTSMFLNCDNLIMEDLNRQETINDNDNDETVLCSFKSIFPSKILNEALFIQTCLDSNRQETINDNDNDETSFTSNIPSNLQNEAINIQNSDDSNSFLNTPPILQDDSFDNSEYDQNSTINGNNEQTLLANDCSSCNDLSEKSSCSILNQMSDNLSNTSENYSSSTIVLDNNQEITDNNLSKNIEQSTQNNKNLSDNQDSSEFNSLQQTFRQFFYGIETSDHISSEDSSSKSSGDTVRIDS